MTRIKPEIIYVCDRCQKNVDVDCPKELFAWLTLRSVRDELVPRARDRKWRRDFCSIECLENWLHGCLLTGEKEIKQQEAEPLPCPWCGSKDVEFHLVMGCPSGRQAVCKSCHASGPIVRDLIDVSDAAVVEAWNGRKSEGRKPELPCTLVELATTLQTLCYGIDRFRPDWGLECNSEWDRLQEVKERGLEIARKILEPLEMVDK